MLFDVKVLERDGQVRLLQFDAHDVKAATYQAESKGFSVLAVKRRGGLGQRSLGFRSSVFPLLLFSQELLALLESGLSLLEALEALSEKEQPGPTRFVLDGVVARLQEGKALSAALEQFPDVFPPLYVASVRASEKTGDLPEALSRFVQYQSQIDVVRKKVINASIYPVLLLIVGGLVTVFLMTYVVPRFSVIYESNTKSLPWMSQVLLNWGTLWAAHTSLIATSFLIAIGFSGFALSRVETRRWMWRRLWGLPTIGERLFMYQLTRFYRTLSMLIKSGIPVVTSLEMVAGLLDANLRERLQKATQDIREGHSISQAMERHGLTTPIALRMLRVGERSGRMGEMMERIATFLDEEMARWVEWFARLFEPILMAVIGVIIGVIVVLMYMPVFELAGSIG